MGEINVPQGLAKPLGITPTGITTDPTLELSAENREKILAAQKKTSDTKNYLGGVQAETIAEIGERPDQKNSSDLIQVQYTLTNWTSNGDKLMHDAGDAFNRIAQDPTAFLNSLQNTADASLNAVSKFSEDALKSAGLTADMIAKGGAEILKVPTLAVMSSLELMGGLLNDIAHGKNIDEIKANLEKNRLAQIEKLAKQIPNIKEILDSTGGAVKFAGSLLKSVGDTIGLTDIWDGVTSGDFNKVGQGLRKFALEATGWESMNKAWDALKKGDFVGFSTNLCFGVAGMTATVSSVMTLGGSTAAFLGAKAVVKGTMATLTKEGMEVLAKETGERVTQATANELKELLATQVPKELAKATPKEMLEHVLKQSGKEMYADFKEDLVKNLKNPEMLKKFELPQDTLEQLQKGTIDQASKVKLDTLVKETSKEATFKRTNELIEKLKLNEKLPEISDKVVTELLDDLSQMSKKDLEKRFTQLLSKNGHSAEEATQLAKEYAWRVKDAVKGGKVDHEIVDVLTNSIHKDFTGSIRTSFETSLQKGMPDILNDLKITDKALREELTERWSKAALEGFEEGLQPIKSLIREGVEQAVKRRRQRDDNNKAAALAPEQKKNYANDNSITENTDERMAFEYSKEAKQSSKKGDDKVDDEWLKQRDAETQRVLEREKQKLEKVYESSSSLSKSKNEPSINIPSSGKSNNQADNATAQNVESYRKELSIAQAPEELPPIFKG